MTIAELRGTDFHQLVDWNAGLIDRKIFSDEEIYRLELERIFARTWNFMCHESQIPNVGDFFLNYIGEDRVIVVRDKEGGIQVLLNTCRHRGNAVCRAEEGHATSFMCTYHGWTYDLKGKLVGVPGFKDYYHEDLDREAWGLVAAPHVDSYKGFVFASLDPEAPDFDDFLGDVGRIGISMIAERGEDVRIVGGVEKYTVGCNWKFSVDNVYDWYHVRLTHASAIIARPVRYMQGLGQDLSQMTSILGEWGHTIGGPSYVDTPEMPNQHRWWRERPETKHALGPVGMRSNGHPNIFPNTWMVTTNNQLLLRHPRGPLKTEVWCFTLVDRSLLEKEPQRYYAAVRSASQGNGPGGMFEQEDGENWAQSTVGTTGTHARKFPLNFAMDKGHNEVVSEEGGPPYIEGKINEHPQLWTWHCWADWMSADSWSELKANHAAVPIGVI